MSIVSKFGGSSLSSEIQFKKVKKIIKENPERCIVVVSALGKRANEDNKVTDLLYLLHAHIKHGVAYDSLWETIKQRFLNVKQELNLAYNINQELSLLKDQLTSSVPTVDYLVSRGEYLTAKLMSEYLDFDFIDAKDVIIFQPNGKIDLDKSRKQLLQILPKDLKVVIPGFYGAYLDGKIKLLDRGGSDITGSIVASCLGASKYENWTDVSGVLMADPRIIKNPATIPNLTYEELTELAYMGASVLHEETIHPIRDLNIPVHIKNTNQPHADGTLICNQFEGNKNMITGISGKKDFISITIYKNHMSSEVGFLHRTLEIFNRYDINIEHLPTGIDHVGVIVSAQCVDTCLYDLIESLKVELNIDEVTVKKEIALITIVGREIIKNPGLSGVIFQALGEKHINVLLIAQSPRELNIVIGVQNSDYIPATQILYEKLVHEKTNH